MRGGAGRAKNGAAGGSTNKNVDDMWLKGKVRRKAIPTRWVELSATQSQSKAEEGAG